MLSALFLVLTHQNRVETKVLIIVEWRLGISAQIATCYELAIEICRVFFFTPLIFHRLNNESQTKISKL